MLFCHLTKSAIWGRMEPKLRREAAESLWHRFCQLMACQCCFFLAGTLIPLWHWIQKSPPSFLLGVVEKPLRAGSGIGAGLTFICGIYPKDIQGLGTKKCTTTVSLPRFTRNQKTEWEQGFSLKQRVKTRACGWLPWTSKLGVSDPLVCRLKQQPGFLLTHLKLTDFPVTSSCIGGREVFLADIANKVTSIQFDFCSFLPWDFDKSLYFACSIFLPVPKKL